MDQRQGLSGRAVAPVLANFNVLVLFEGEQKFSGGEIVLITSGEPEAGGDLGLLEKEDAAAIELAENAGAEGNVAHDVGFGAGKLAGCEIDPDFGGDVSHGVLKHGARMIGGIGRELEDVAKAAVDGFLAHPLHEEGGARSVNQLCAIGFLLLPFGVGRFRTRIFGLEHEFEHVFPGLQLFAVGCGIDRSISLFQEDLERAGSGGNHAIGFFFEQARACAAGAVHLVLDALVLLDGLVVAVLVFDQLLGARL